MEVYAGTTAPNRSAFADAKTLEDSVTRKRILARYLLFSFVITYLGGFSLDRFAPSIRWPYLWSFLTALALILVWELACWFTARLMTSPRFVRAVMEHEAPESLRSIAARTVGTTLPGRIGARFLCTPGARPTSRVSADQNGQMYRAIGVFVCIAIIMAIAATVNHQSSEKRVQPPQWPKGSVLIDCTPEQITRWNASEQQRLANLTPAQKQAANNAKDSKTFFTQFAQVCTKKAYNERFGTSN